MGWIFVTLTNNYFKPCCSEQTGCLALLLSPALWHLKPRALAALQLEGKDSRVLLSHLHTYPCKITWYSSPFSTEALYDAT